MAIAKAEDIKILLSNFTSLMSLRLMNMLLPLITMPYLVRVLGVEKFGLVNFALAIIMFFNLFVSFGFDLSVTREISINRDDKRKIAEIFSSVLLIKMVFVILSFVVLCGLIALNDTIGDNAQLYFITFGVVVGNALLPLWFFQGIEKMKHITYINVASRLFFAIMIFVLVKDKSDYIYVPLLNSIGTIVGGVYAIIFIRSVFNIGFVIPKIESAIYQLRNSAHFFLSRVANEGARYFASVLIGFKFGDLYVGYYTMVDKLFTVFMSGGGIVSQTIYPYMSRERNIRLFKRIFVVIIGLTIIGLVPLIIYRNEILELVFNNSDKIVSDIFLIMFSGGVFGIASILIGYPLLAAFGFIREANFSLIYASVFFVIVAVGGILAKNIYIVSMSVVVYELIGLLLRIYYVKKNKIIKC